MTTIRQNDFVSSIADALQYISYYHPMDYITALGEAYKRELSPAARDAIAQILTNSRMCAEGRRPICQDTGIVVVFLKIGMDVRWDAQMSVEEMVNEGVRRAYTDPDNVLRTSIVSDPAGARKNTKDNTPAVIHMQVVPGDKVEIDVAANGKEVQPHGPKYFGLGGLGQPADSCRFLRQARCCSARHGPFLAMARACGRKPARLAAAGTSLPGDAPWRCARVPDSRERR